MTNFVDLERDVIGTALRDDGYRNQLVQDPRAVLDRELARIKPGLKLPAGVSVRVVQQAAGEICIVLPAAAGASDAPVKPTILDGDTFPCITWMTDICGCA